jgi:hypothetical protein
MGILIKVGLKDGLLNIHLMPLAIVITFTASFFQIERLLVSVYSAFLAVFLEV